MGYIYMIRNKINGKIYIGQTIRPIKKRLEEHQTKARCVAIHGAIEKYGWGNFEKDWYECPDEDLNFDEELLVREMETVSPNGYNLIEGGGSGGKRSEETKQRMRKARLGKTTSKETIQKQQKVKSGKNNPMYGNTGEKHSRSKRIYQYDLDGNFINSFGSSREAARYVTGDGANNTHIGERARDQDKRKTAYNFKWSYDMDIIM
jgi:group I intron endonuclease